MDKKEEIISKILAIFREYGLTYGEAQDIASEISYRRLRDCILAEKI